MTAKPNATCPPYRRAKYRRALRDLSSVAGFVVALLAARSSLADHYRVPSGSMKPTVKVGDRVVVDKAAYGLRIPFSDVRVTPIAMPARGDVVVLESPEDGSVLLKRVVAIAGDEVHVVHGRVWIDGEPTALVHALSLTHGGGPDFGPTVVPEDKLLVMGDNRGNSHDGRRFGYVRVQAVLGRALAVYVRHGSLRWVEL
jgi:signal peptidase I